MSGESARPPEIGRKPIPSRRLDKQIRDAVTQYAWDRYSLGDLYDSEKEEPTPAGRAADDPLLRIVLLCRARSRDWSGVLKKAMKYANGQHYHERPSRHLLADTAAAEQDRNDLYQEMASRLINPYTMEPVDITEMGPITLAREVADGRIELDYVPATDDARERI